MIDVKEASHVAAQYFDAFYADEGFKDVRLEEIERLEEDGDVFWLITLGFTEEKPLLFGGPSGERRRYKRFKIDADTGDVHWMRIRTPENA